MSLAVVWSLAVVMSLGVDVEVVSVDVDVMFVSLDKVIVAVSLNEKVAVAVSPRNFVVAISLDEIVVSMDKVVVAVSFVVVFVYPFVFVGCCCILETEVDVGKWIVVRARKPNRATTMNKFVSYL